MWRKRDVDRRVSAAQPGRGFYGGGRALRCDVHSVWAASEQSAGRHVAVGNGQLFCTAYSREALRTLGVAPDREVPSSQNASVDYIHRRTSDTGIYFIRNTQPTLLQTPVTLRVDGKQPGLLENHLPRGDHRRSHATAGRIRLPLGQQIPFGQRHVASALGQDHSVFCLSPGDTKNHVHHKQPENRRLHELIDTTNLSPNRIIGDAQTDAGKYFTQTNIRKYTADSPLLPSGPLGPVTLTPVYHLAPRP